MAVCKQGSEMRKVISLFKSTHTVGKKKKKGQVSSHTATSLDLKNICVSKSFSIVSQC